MADGQALTKAHISAGGKVAPIVPQSFDEAYRVAQVLAASGMTPKDINTPEKVMVAIMAGAEIGMAPFQAVQSFAIINGRPTLWGDGMMGVVRAQGVKVKEYFSEDGTTAWCEVTRPSGEQIVRSFSEADAKAAGLWNKQGPWTTYRKRMMQMRARAWALRDGCADMLRGIHMAEEAQDVEVIENTSLDERPLLAGYGNGARKDALVEDWNARMRQCTEIEEVDDIVAEVENYPEGRFSDNVMTGIYSVAAEEKERINAGIAPRAPKPSPFEELKAQGLAVIEIDDEAARLVAHGKWLSRVNSKTNQALMSPREREEIKTLKKTIKSELGQNSAGQDGSVPADGGASMG